MKKKQTPAAKTESSGSSKGSTAGTGEPKALGAFDFVTAILKTKRNLIAESPDPTLAAKAYNPFLTNMALSNHVDTVMVANEMNAAHWVDHDQQFVALLNSVRAMNRKHSWAKKAKDDDMALVTEYYQVNPVRAREFLSLSTPADLDSIRRRLEKGGRVK